MFYYLSQILADESNAESIRYVAGVVLKNTLRNHVITLKKINNTELLQIKELLLNILIQ